MSNDQGNTNQGNQKGGSQQAGVPKGGSQPHGQQNLQGREHQHQSGHGQQNEAGAKKQQAANDYRHGGSESQRDSKDSGGKGSPDGQQPAAGSHGEGKLKSK